MVKTFAAGVGNDAFVAIGGLGISAFFAGLLTIVFLLLKSDGNRVGETYARSLSIASLVVASSLAVISTADISYYGYNHQHLDFVFFEYIDELLHAATQGASSQAAEQTGAELEDGRKWIFRIGGFWLLATILVTIWNHIFVRIIVPRFNVRSRPYSVLLAVLLITTASVSTGGGPIQFPSKTWWWIENEAYHSLSQNPIIFAQHSFRDAFLSKWTWLPGKLPEQMSEAEAIETARLAIGEGRTFPYPGYPLVRLRLPPQEPYSHRPTNVLLIFVEGLDRRYLDRVHPVYGSLQASGSAADTFHNVRLTPFLDHLKEESLYFSHFFSNGVQTTRGLFSTLCSGFPRQGTAVIKTRYTHDFLCLPSLLRKAGYRTEMVVSLDGDLPGLKAFLQRNGIEHYYGEQNFPSDAERRGVGLTDGALLDMLETRINALQTSQRPFFLATLTSGMHHPFTVPTDHPDVRALQADPDKYMAALRYFDFRLERFFTRLRSRGLLDNTVVIILGDHGRHEAEGRTDLARQIGHFMSPLFIWLDDSLRSSFKFHPHSVEQVASQVDIAPTILAVNGLTPPLAPFVGRDLSCLFSGVCLEDNRAYLSSVYDDLIGLADNTGIWLYSFRRGAFSHTGLDLSENDAYSAGEAPKTHHYGRLMSALYLTFNQALEGNTVWSWRALGDKLQE